MDVNGALVVADKVANHELPTLRDMIHALEILADNYRNCKDRAEAWKESAMRVNAEPAPAPRRFPVGADQPGADVKRVRWEGFSAPVGWFSCVGCLTDSGESLWREDGADVDGPWMLWPWSRLIGV